LPGSNAATYSAYQLTCCTKTDLDQLWQPGATVDLHWIVEKSTRTTVRPTHHVLGVAVLMGPYTDVTAAKQASGATNAVQGSVVTMDDRTAPPAPEVTSFFLPADLPPGYYRLDFKTDFGDGSSAGGSSIVRVGTQ
jgi:hypothetical protein